MLELLFSSIATGGLTGLLGAALQRFADYKQARLQLDILRVKNAHDLLMRDKDLAMMKEEWAGRFRVAEKEGETSRDVAESAAFQKSLLREPERYAVGRPEGTLGNIGWFLLACTDVLRGVVRPVLTIYLCVLVTYIWYLVRDELSFQENLDPDEIVGIWKLVVQTILYVWTTCTLWWFGTRNKQQQPGTPRPA